MNAHELGFTAFLAEPGQRRMRTLLELGPKRRKDARALLDHSVRLDPRYASRLPSVKGTEELLRAHGAPETCYVISSDERLDRREMSLKEALEAVEGSFAGTFISCIPGKLAYFEYEDIKSAYLLRK